MLTFAIPDELGRIVDRGPRLRGRGRDPGRGRRRRPHGLVKTFVSGAFGRILDRAVQVFGSHGIATDLPIAQWYADARAARIYDGASEVHRMVVARELLKYARDGGSTSPACGDLR